MLSTALVMAAALLLDRLLGEPTRLHPLAGFGRYAAWLERSLNRNGASRLTGSATWLLAITPLLLLLGALWQLPALHPWIDVAVLYFALGLRSLHEHAQAVAQALQHDDLPLARQRVGMIVSRDTSSMQSSDVARAGVESVLENGNDAVFGALFWFVLLGAPGALLYRLANTLDAMWGYRTSRYLHFGWAAARLDDLLNFIPARLTAFSYALFGNTRTALRCWKQQAQHWSSPNAGPVMASGAGSLSVQLGGAAQYHGVTEARPLLGAGGQAAASDIVRALALVQRSAWLWVGCALLIGGGLHA